MNLQDDIIQHAIGGNEAGVLLRLDLSAAFDTVPHVIRLDRLSRRCGITGSVQEWLASYLTISHTSCSN